MTRLLQICSLGALFWIGQFAHPMENNADDNLVFYNETGYRLAFIVVDGQSWKHEECSSEFNEGQGAALRDFLKTYSCKREEVGTGNKILLPRAVFVSGKIYILLLDQDYSYASFKKDSPWSIETKLFDVESSCSFFKLLPLGESHFTLRLIVKERIKQESRIEKYWSLCIVQTHQSDAGMLEVEASCPFQAYTLH